MSLTEFMRSVLLQGIKDGDPRVTHIKVIDTYGGGDGTSDLLPISWNNASSGSIVQSGNVDHEFQVDFQVQFTKVELWRSGVDVSDPTLMGDVTFTEPVSSSTAGTIRISDLTINLPE